MNVMTSYTGRGIALPTAYSPQAESLAQSQQPAAPVDRYVPSLPGLDQDFTKMREFARRASPASPTFGRQGSRETFAAPVQNAKEVASNGNGPVGKFVIFAPNGLGPINASSSDPEKNKHSLDYSIRMNGLDVEVVTKDPGFRGYKDGVSVLEFQYLPNKVRKNGGDLLLGESRRGMVYIYGGSIKEKMAEKRAQGRCRDLSDAQLLENIATYAAKHEVLYHHTGNFIERDGRRFNIVDDEYTRDGYLESGNPIDIERNVPVRLSPEHPFIKQHFGR